MFKDVDLQNHLETSSTVKTQSAIIAEWNMNIAENILTIGNYRYRPALGPADKFGLPLGSFDPTDAGEFYTGATDADAVVDGGLDSENMPIAFISKKEKEKLLYSLEDCFGKFRPRSGINKLRYFSNGFSHHSNINMSRRPRYYMAHKDDSFKYWSSYRTENGIERGIANQLVNGQYYIDDASPFVVYKNPIPTNRIITKIQTNVGEVDLGPFSNSSGSFVDPFYGDQNKTTPSKWKVQVLKDGSWVDVVSFNQSSTRLDGSAIIGSDGYVELSYGLIIPERYRDIFVRAEEYFSETFLPEKSSNGYAYLIREQESDVGVYYIWLDKLGRYQTFVPEYGWYLEESVVDRLTNFVTDLISPPSYIDQISGTEKYREHDMISGIRIVVDTMNRVDSIFDLIEISPRLSVNLSDKVEEFSITKAASDLGNSGMPVGQLLAGVGNITLFDYDLAFSSTNTNSIIKDYITRNIQFKIYEVIVNVDGYDYFVPLKTMYSEGIPEVSSSERSVSFDLRDMFFYFESQIAPQILIQDASLSYAVSLLLDSVGFSNYVFKRLPNEADPIIPYFFVSPDTNIAEVLNDLAVSTQTAMFFDEYNNFVLLSKEYMLPDGEERDTDITLYGSKDFVRDGVVSNSTTNEKLANIIDISSNEDSVYNNGKISYTTRYIQRSYGSLRQAMMIDQEKTWIYKPALLWEVSGTESTKSINDVVNNQSSYVLGAIPLAFTLTDVVPYVENGIIQNNIINFGEGVYWITRYNGYFYANGEVIRYDAVEYDIPGVNRTILEQIDNGEITERSETSGGIGTVWISSVREYQKYFSKLPFNGKMYPTGRVRVYSEPNYVIENGIYKLSDGPVAKHGRGQFGTPVANHFAGLSSYWSSNDNVRGCQMLSSQLFGKPQEKTVTVGAAGVKNTLAKSSSRTGIIKNFLTYNPSSEKPSPNTLTPGTIQSSALAFTGPSFTTTEKPIDFISYIHKPLDNKYKHFGTRMRIVGKIESNSVSGQTPVGSSTYFIGNANKPDQSVVINGASGGIAVLLNPETNNGYYFEIAALTENNVESYDEAEDIHNVLFYKIVKENGSDGTQAIPVKLWGGLSQIVVDDGKFTGQYRLVTEDIPTVYDLGVEYQDIGSLRKFFLYINNKLIATVIDENPLPIYSNMALFIRGSSRAMFENVYAITNNYSQNTVYALDNPVNAIFSEDEIDVNESFRKYALSGVIQATYLSGISPSEPPKYNMYYEEFGTIMREAAYFNVRYDKAYPALTAQLSPTFNKIKGYTTSGFIASAYGAEFMIFNATDTALSLDETSGNFLRIQGVTFTQESKHELTVDEYFSRKSDQSKPEFVGNELVSYPTKEKQNFKDIKVSRMTHGNSEFSLDAPYVQSHDQADNLMSWMISKVMKPRKSVGVNVFSLPTLQLGDIVNISYRGNDGIDVIADPSQRFVVYQIDYSKTIDGPDMTAYLSEVS